MSLTKVTYSMIHGAVVNVFDFGATGNGVTDDTAAIQAAINYAEASATPPSAAPGVVTFKYENVTAGSILVTAHDWIYTVSRSL